MDAKYLVPRVGSMEGLQIREEAHCSSLGPARFRDTIVGRLQNTPGFDSPWSSILERSVILVEGWVIPCGHRTPGNTFMKIILR